MQAAGEISPEADIELTCTNLGTGPNQPEQLLLDCYVRTMWSGGKLASSGTVAHYGCWPSHGWMEWLSCGRVQR